MHFGEYLVQRKVLSAHQILKALAAQHRRRHFIPLLLVEAGALPDYHVLKLWTEADLKHEDFLQVLEHEGVVSAQQVELIHAAWVRSCPPLGSLLVELGLIDETTREELLIEFEAAKEELGQKTNV